MKLAWAQINSTVGDFEGNLRRVREAYRTAQRSGADLAIFPEMVLSGYPPLDLLERSAFIEANLRALRDFQEDCHGTDACIGFVEPNPAPTGKRLFNAAAFVSQGEILAIHHKALLPTYDVFDEARYFQPDSQPTLVPRPYGRIAVSLCEDIWNDPGVWDGRRPYDLDPLEPLEPLRPDLLVNLSASPFHSGKVSKRFEIARGIVGRLRCALAYVNAVGANDGLIFDGQSFGMNRDGRLSLVGPAFREECLLGDPEGALDPTEGKMAGIAAADAAVLEVVEALTIGVRDFCEKLGFQRVVLGLSGGIDSAVVAALAVRALGREKVTALSMPSRHSSEGTRRDARLLAENLGIAFHEVGIEEVCEAFRASLTPIFGEKIRGITDENLQARVRGVLLMAWANQHDALVLNTGNKSEAAVGYSTLYGDMVGGLAVIGDLTKDWVYRVGRALQGEGLGIPEGIFVRAPSAELRPDQRDEDSLPPYPVLDQVLEAVVVGNASAREAVAAGLPADAVSFVLDALARSEFKRRQAPMSLKVTRRAFGLGRRYPIVARFREGWS